MADLSLGLLRRCEPVRTPGVYQRQRHMPGRWFSTTSGRFLEYESLLEREWMLMMDFDREVEWICEQPLRLRYVKDGKPASHVPDLLVWRHGVPELLMSRARSGWTIRCSGLRSTRPGERALRPGLVTGCCRSPIGNCCANVRWLAGFRERPPNPDGERPRMLAMAAAGSCTIAELLCGAREPMLARPVLMNVLWAGDALVDVSASIDENSVVWTRLRVAG